MICTLQDQKIERNTYDRFPEPRELFSNCMFGQINTSKLKDIKLTLRKKVSKYSHLRPCIFLTWLQWIYMRFYWTEIQV